ncbi:DUF5958 family protein [Streptomyces sp. NPDC001852]|uniref:DUF5958 family protein n=1 Tax=Streptomyces sp. NPDC001852 TaxID=3364619 RepID=UPI00368414E7
MDERALMLNQLAQGLRPVPAGIAWFGGLDAEEQSAVLRDLRPFCVQARATREDALTDARRRERFCTVAVTPGTG